MPKKDKEEKVERNVKAEKVVPRQPTPDVFEGRTFKDANEVPMVFTGTFEDCEFKMDSLERRNFSGVKFKGCKFPKDFKFVRCNLYNATGVDEVTKERCLVARLPRPPAPETTKDTKKKKR